MLSIHSDLLSKHKTDVNRYNGFIELLNTEIGIQSEIDIRIQLSYYGYKLYPEKCLNHIEKAMILSNQIEHNHRNAGELFLLYAKLHKQSNKDYNPSPILRKGKEVLANRIISELKKRNPYKTYFKGWDHEAYVWEVNEGKKYMRDAGYDDVGKDKKVSIFYRIGKAISLSVCIHRNLSFWQYALRSGDITYIRDIYYYDFLNYYLDLSADGYDITKMPDHRHARFYIIKDGKTFYI